MDKRAHDLAPSPGYTVSPRDQVAPAPWPQYTSAERLLDGLVHALGIVLSLGAVTILIESHIPARGAVPLIAAMIYGGGLIAMLWLSAAYNLLTRPSWKERAQRYDHAAIFLMIAGTYSPFALITLGGVVGHTLLALVWLIALAGVSLKLFRFRQFERSSLIVYLALGWIGLPAVGMLAIALPTPALMLLGLGGILYTVGVGFHLWTSLHFHNAVWHGFVLVAAICHFVVVLQVVAS